MLVLKGGLSIQTKIKKRQRERKEGNQILTLEKQSLEIAGYLPSFHRKARAFHISVSVHCI